MPPLRIALLQLPSHGCDQNANLAAGEAACHEAAQSGADIALFPELWSIGFTPCPADEPGRREWLTRAIPEDSPFIGHFRALAGSLRLAIGLTYLEHHDPAPRNAFCLIGRAGEIVLRYAKVHTCDFDWERAFTPGDAFHVSALDTAKGEVQIGAMICYDREFPESARVLMLQGAEIILTPNACDLDEARIGQFQARAFENMLGVAMANYAPPIANGHSCAFDGIKCEADETARDMRLLEAPETPGVYYADFNMEALREYRSRETWGNAFRKPYAYGPLLDTEVSEPFVRDSSRREPPGPTP